MVKEIFLGLRVPISIIPIDTGDALGHPSEHPFRRLHRPSLGIA
jgi:hypothetical protein